MQGSEDISQKLAKHDHTVPRQDNKLTLKREGPAVRDSATAPLITLDLSSRRRSDTSLNQERRVVK